MTTDPTPSATHSDHDIERVLSLWFGELNADGRASAEKMATWFKKDDAFDQHLRQEFTELHQSIVAGQRESWQETPRGILAYIVVLDQLSRNMFRNSAEMFAQDERALQAAIKAIGRGDDRKLPLDPRTFIYMPFMHSEQLAYQNRCVELFEALRDQQPEPMREGIAKKIHFAVQHRDIIARFGRFPHRNQLLGRCSTPEEIEFLQHPGSSF